jgi:hypothetical protein
MSHGKFMTIFSPVLQFRIKYYLLYNILDNCIIQISDLFVGCEPPVSGTEVYDE